MSGDAQIEELLQRLDLDRLGDILSEQNKRGRINIIYLTGFERDNDSKHVVRYIAKGLVDLFGYISEDAKRGFEIGIFPADIIVESGEDLSGNIKRSVIVSIPKLDIKYETELGNVLKD